VRGAGHGQIDSNTLALITYSPSRQKADNISGGSPTLESTFE
jgi:hypothetical protein